MLDWFAFLPHTDCYSAGPDVLKDPMGKPEVMLNQLVLCISTTELNSKSMREKRHLHILHPSLARMSQTLP